MSYNYQFSRLEPCYTNREQTGICHLVVGLSCTFTGIINSVEVEETAYIDKRFSFGSIISYEELTGNLQTYANDFATEEGWWNLLKTRVSGRVYEPGPIQGASLLSENESLTISANPVE